MQTIRRIYFYAIALISLETIVWGLIGLLRSIASPQLVGGSVERLAAPLAFVLVGLPVFALHWRWIQRSAASSSEEAAAWVRTAFFYLALAVTFVPIVQNAWAFLGRTLLVAFGGDAWQAFVGGRQTITDNAVAVVINALAGSYFYQQLRRHWQVEVEPANSAEAAPVLPENFTDIRRLYRYLWLVYGLGIAVFGVEQLLQFILLSPLSLGLGGKSSLANGLAMIVVGFPLWVFTRQLINRSLAENSESQSWLRLIVLFLLTVFSLAGFLYQCERIVEIILRAVLGEGISVYRLMSYFRPPLSFALPLLAVWWEYSRSLKQRISLMTKIEDEWSVWRLYRSILALGGLAVWLGGVGQILNFVIDLSANPQVSWGDDSRRVLAGGIAMLIIGFPLWRHNWQPLAKEAARSDAMGEHSRRSLVRKSVLYLLIFAGVVGVMFSSGALLYRLLSAVLGSEAQTIVLDVLRNLRLMVIFTFVLVYHLRALRSDLRETAGELAARRAAYRVGLYIGEEDVLRAVQTALAREAPDIPVVVLPSEQAINRDDLAQWDCLVLSSRNLLSSSTGKLEVLREFAGQRVVLAESIPGWNWLGNAGMSQPTQARRAAKYVRLLAEGEQMPRSVESSPWMILIYILAGLMALEILFMLTMLGVSTVVD